MADFAEKLWESIFTAGPTPTLLVATNASFAALQVLLFAMLLATYSIHSCAAVYGGVSTGSPSKSKQRRKKRRKQSA
jgi:hypothetical protein